ncbi:MAG: hypothetical protein ACTSXV_01270 [Alphaproteobacteria bacterium]
MRAPFKIGALNLDVYLLSDTDLFIGSIFDKTGSFMIPEKEEIEKETPSWMTPSKERIDSPPALLLKAYDQIKEMCEKAFKGYIPFEIKPFILFADETLSNLKMLKDKYEKEDVFLIGNEGNILPSIESFLGENKYEPPSQSFVEFSSTLAHYFDSSYKVISSEEEEED